MSDITQTVGTRQPPTFEQELTTLINRHSMESGSNTPDFILAEYLRHCMFSFNIAVLSREKHYGRPMPCTCGPTGGCTDPCDRPKVVVPSTGMTQQGSSLKPVYYDRFSPIA